MSAAHDRKFEGWAGVDEKAAQGGLVYQSFEPKPWDEDDIEVKVKFCGICGSDLHILAGDWGKVNPSDPYVCGHEIVGEVVRVGSQVKDLQLGDNVGIGAQSDSCRECRSCLRGEGQLCLKKTWTWNSAYRHGIAGKAKATSKGGFARYWRGPSGYAVKIPESIDLASAAPMFCGGITSYSPLEQYGAGTTAKRVGVIGIGGLGHYAVMFAKAMGAEVTAISRNRSKEGDAKKLGASEFVAMSEGIAGHEASLDLIICTINPDTLDLSPYMPLLDAYGTLVIVGISPKLNIKCNDLITANRKVAGSNIGSPEQIKRMLKLVEEHKLESWIEKYDMEDINQALIDFEKKDPRFRYVLVNKDLGGKL